MPSRKIDERELLDRLAGVFRSQGFEGASLSMISKATGLQRASLYHRFPGGKTEMALAVLKQVKQGLTEFLVAPLREPGVPRQRIKMMCERLETFYESGRKPCILEALTLGQADPVLRGRLREIADTWVEAMASVSRDAGVSPAHAREKAEEALVRIQGSLVVSRVMGKPDRFLAMLAGLPALLCGRT